MVAHSVGLTDQGTTGDGRVGLLVAAREDVSACRVFGRQAGGLCTHDGCGLISLLLPCLGHEKVVHRLLQVELCDSQLVRSISEFLLQMRDEGVGVVEGRVRAGINILRGGECGLSVVVNLVHQVDCIPSSSNNGVRLLFLGLCDLQLLLSLGIGVEGEVVDVPRVEV